MTLAFTGRARLQNGAVQSSHSPAPMPCLAVKRGRSERSLFLAEGSAADPVVNRSTLIRRIRRAAGWRGSIDAGV